MNYILEDLIEKTGLDLDANSIDLLQKEKEVQLLSSINIHKVAHLFTNPESYFLEASHTLNS